ncbi:hypothetical protein LTR02_018239, partial [Friedmanniomyces endolithicus]
NTRDNPGRHEDDRKEGLDDAPALRRPAVSLGGPACIGAVDFAEDEIVADVLHAVEGAHFTDKEHEEAKRFG